MTFVDDFAMSRDGPGDVSIVVEAAWSMAKRALLRVYNAAISCCTCWRVASSVPEVSIA